MSDAQRSLLLLAAERLRRLADCMGKVAQEAAHSMDAINRVADAFAAQPEQPGDDAISRVETIDADD